MRELLMLVTGLLWIAACVQQPANPPAARPAAGKPAAPLPHEDFHTYCTHAACQHDVDIDLVQANGGRYHRHFDLLPPSVQPHLVTVHPGQTVKAAASFEDGKFIGWSEAAAAKPGDVLLTFKLQQGIAGMMLSVHNDSDRPVKLTLLKVDLQAADDEPEHTSSCPVMARGGDFETWPEPVFEIDVRSAGLVPAVAGICN